MMLRSRWRRPPGDSACPVSCPEVLLKPDRRGAPGGVGARGGRGSSADQGGEKGTSRPWIRGCASWDPQFRTSPLVGVVEPTHLSKAYIVYIIILGADDSR